MNSLCWINFGGWEPAGYFLWVFDTTIAVRQEGGVRYTAVGQLSPRHELRREDMIALQEPLEAGIVPA